MLSTLLAGTDVTGVAGSVVSIGAAAASAGQAEGLAHKSDALARVVGEYVHEAVRVRVATDAGAGAPRPPRLTHDAARAERLKALRSKDAALNAAVDALDLELLE
jgi:hypothetical protein